MNSEFYIIWNLTETLYQIRVFISVNLFFSVTNKRHNRHPSSQRKRTSNIRVKVTKNSSTKNNVNKKRGAEISNTKETSSKQETEPIKNDVEEFHEVDDLEHFTIQKKECQKISSSKWGKIRVATIAIAILKNEEGYKMLTKSKVVKVS